MTARPHPGILAAWRTGSCSMTMACTPATRRVSRTLREAGFSYDSRRHRVSRTGTLEAVLPYRYLGADDRAGPNYTGQPAVTSHYE